MLQCIFNVKIQTIQNGGIKHARHQMKKKTIDALDVEFFVLLEFKQVSLHNTMHSYSAHWTQEKPQWNGSSKNLSFPIRQKRSLHHQPPLHVFCSSKFMAFGIDEQWVNSVARFTWQITSTVLWKCSHVFAYFMKPSYNQLFCSLAAINKSLCVINKALFLQEISTEAVYLFINSWT